MIVVGSRFFTLASRRLTSFKPDLGASATTSHSKIRVNLAHIVARQNNDPQNITMDIGVVLKSVTFSGVASASLYAGLWGNWTTPIGVWQWNDSTTSTGWSTAVCNRTYPKDQVVQMATSPISLNNLVQVTDDYDGFSSSAKVLIRIHAPQESPVQTSDARAYDEWQRVSSDVIFEGNPITFTDTIAHSETITTQVNIGDKITMQSVPAQHPFVSEVNASSNYGVASTITETIGFTDREPSNAVVGHPYALFKRNFWREKRGFYLAYSPSGYVGLGDYLHTLTVSDPSKAPYIDFEYDVREDSIH